MSYRHVCCLTTLYSVDHEIIYQYGAVAGVRISKGVLRRNLPQYQFISHNPKWPWPGIEPGPPRWEVYGQPVELWHVLSWVIVPSHSHSIFRILCDFEYLARLMFVYNGVTVFVEETVTHKLSLKVAVSLTSYNIDYKPIEKRFE
jgi:hypothetical protein